MRLALAATLTLFTVPALAQDPIVYTGCLKLSDGSLYSVREGNAPMAPCKAKDRQISWNMAGPQGPPGPSSVPQYLEVPVDCNSAPPESINAALTRQADRLTVVITGECTEGVQVRRDDVTLRGANSAARITAPEGQSAVFVQGQRVSLIDLTLTGGWWTLSADAGASLGAYNLTISGAAGPALMMTNGVTAYLQDSTIAGGQGSGAQLQGSQLTLWNSHVTDNVGPGIDALGASTVTLYGTEIAGNQYGVYLAASVLSTVGGITTIVDNGIHGVQAYASHVNLGSCQITGNGGDGVNLADGSVARFSDVTSVNNAGYGVLARNGSAISVLGTSTVEGGDAPGIRLEDTCTAALEGPSYSITGSPVGISCAAPPSVAQLTWPLLPAVTTNCQAPTP